jgi:hypothetical protein
LTRAYLTYLTRARTPQWVFSVARGGIMNWWTTAVPGQLVGKAVATLLTLAALQVARVTVRRVGTRPWSSTWEPTSVLAGARPRRAVPGQSPSSGWPALASPREWVVGAGFRRLHRTSLHGRWRADGIIHVKVVRDATEIGNPTGSRPAAA